MSNGKEGQTGWVIHHLGGVIYVWKAESRSPGPPSLTLTAAKAKSIADPCRFRWPRNQEQMLTLHAYQQSFKKKKKSLKIVLSGPTRSWNSSPPAFTGLYYCAWLTQCWGQKLVLRYTRHHRWFVTLAWNPLYSSGGAERKGVCRATRQ